MLPAAGRWTAARQCWLIEMFMPLASSFCGKGVSFADDAEASSASLYCAASCMLLLYYFMFAMEAP